MNLLQSALLTLVFSPLWLALLGWVFTWGQWDIVTSLFFFGFFLSYVSSIIWLLLKKFGSTLQNPESPSFLTNSPRYVVWLSALSPFWIPWLIGLPKDAHNLPVLQIMGAAFSFVIMLVSGTILLLTRKKNPAPVIADVQTSNTSRPRFPFEAFFIIIPLGIFLFLLRSPSVRWWVTRPLYGRLYGGRANDLTINGIKVMLDSKTDGYPMAIIVEYDINSTKNFSMDSPMFRWAIQWQPSDARLYNAYDAKTFSLAKWTISPEPRPLYPPGDPGAKIAGAYGYKKGVSYHFRNVYVPGSNAMLPFHPTDNPARQFCSNNQNWRDIIKADTSSRFRVWYRILTQADSHSDTGQTKDMAYDLAPLSEFYRAYCETESKEGLQTVISTPTSTTQAAAPQSEPQEKQLTPPNPTITQRVLLKIFSPPTPKGVVQVSIPPDTKYSELERELGDSSVSSDPFENSLRKSLEQYPSNDRNISPSIPSLRRLAKENMPLLIRYFASNPAWYLRRGGSRAEFEAQRRWQYGDSWLCGGFGTGCYSRRGKDYKYLKPEILVSLFLNPSPNWGPRNTLSEGGPPQEVLFSGSSIESEVIIGSDEFMLDIKDRSPGPERRLTKAAVQEFEAEFSKLLAAQSLGKFFLPPGSNKTGQPKLEVGIPGMHVYHATFWVNPGEMGQVSIRAYELTTKTELVGGSYSSPPEFVGWSENPNELFYGEMDLSEPTGRADGLPVGLAKFKGDLAGSFELWFSPSKGGPERMLTATTVQLKGLW